MRAKRAENTTEDSNTNMNETKEKQREAFQFTPKSCCLFFVAVVVLICTVLFCLSFQAYTCNVKRVQAQGKFYQLGRAVLEYNYLSEKEIGQPRYPEFFDDAKTKELWSWRLILLLPELLEEKHKIETTFDVSKAWNDECNNQYFNLNKIHLQSLFTLDDKSKLVSFVALKGDGTIWTETNNGLINSAKKIIGLRKIILVETVQPINTWSKPGDDISPEDVIRMFEANPGLVQNKGISIVCRKNWPRFFIRSDGSLGRFDAFKNSDELREALLINR